MKIGVLKEIKTHEYRVALTPPAVAELHTLGSEIVIETEAGIGSGFSDSEYILAGGRIETNRKKLFDDADVIVKVKEPLPEEWQYFRKGQILFSYLHLAAFPELTKFLRDKHICALAFETFSQNGNLPLLKPMSQIAGRVGMQAGLQLLQKQFGGKGILASGMPGVRPAKVHVVGAGNVGCQAIDVALGLGAKVVVYDVSSTSLEKAQNLFSKNIETELFTSHAFFQQLQFADVVVGAVLIPGGRAPIIIPANQYDKLNKSTVLVDIAVDQGGCFAHSRPTTHQDPYFIKHDIIHYCVSNIPGAVPRTSSAALANALIPAVKDLIIANQMEQLLNLEQWQSALNLLNGEVHLDALKGL
jgi:alanine dehydrogenase